MVRKVINMFYFCIAIIGIIFVIGYNKPTGKKYPFSCPCFTVMQIFIIIYIYMYIYIYYIYIYLLFLHKSPVSIKFSGIVWRNYLFQAMGLAKDDLLEIIEHEYLLFRSKLSWCLFLISNLAHKYHMWFKLDRAIQAPKLINIFMTWWKLG